MPNVIQFEFQAMSVLTKDGKCYFTFRNAAGDEVKPVGPAGEFDVAIMPRAMAVVEEGAEALRGTLENVRLAFDQADGLIEEALTKAATEARKGLHLRARKPKAVEVPA